LLLQSGCDKAINFEGKNPGLVNATFETKDKSELTPPPPLKSSQEFNDKEPKSNITEKKIIKTAEISIEVKDIKKKVKFG
jgi:hypothetical protein